MIPILTLLVLQAGFSLTHREPHPAAASAYAFVTDPARTELLMAQTHMEDIVYVHMLTGEEPAMGAFDLMNYSPSRLERGQRTRGAVESWIRWAGDDAFVTLSWHWNAPMFLTDAPQREWWRGFYANATTFDLRAALYEPESAEHATLLRDMDAIAVELAKFRAAGIPVFWRPLHEAWGGWFWWGSAGPAAFRDLWRLLHARLTELHGLDHLIWVYTDEHPAWYPGDDVVDVVSVDLYRRSDPTRKVWSDLTARFRGRKPVAVSETDRLPELSRMQERGEAWSWYALWGDDHVRDLSRRNVQAVYASPRTLTRSRLPQWRTGDRLARSPAPAEPSWRVCMDGNRLLLDIPDGDRGRVRVFNLDNRTIRSAWVEGPETWDLSGIPPGPLALSWGTRTEQGYQIIRPTPATGHSPGSTPGDAGSTCRM